MREPPRIAEATLMRAVETGYGLPVSSLTFLPLGADAASAAYRCDVPGGTTCFLKVRARAQFSPASLLVPLFLHEQGTPHLLAPQRTLSGTPWVLLDDFAITLYPFVRGRTAAAAGLSEPQWTALGSTLRLIHESRLPADLLSIVPHERFVPSRRDVIEPLQMAIDRAAGLDALQTELVEFWTVRQDVIRALTARTDELAQQLRGAALSPVLCHADFHTWNILLDEHAQVWIVDWDETILALKERDLMFVIGGIGRDLVSTAETACFLRGYGKAEIDGTALTYYRHAWAVQDMAAYGEQVFFSPDLGEASRRDALEGFKSLFEPDNIVDIASSR